VVTEWIQNSNFEKNNEKINLTEIKSDIVFQNISYKYEWQQFQLFDNFNLTIPYWQKVAIVGRSGSGKSTILKLLTRLVEPESGEIKVKSNIEEIKSNSEEVKSKNLKSIVISSEDVGQKYFFAENNVISFDDKKMDKRMEDKKMDKKYFVPTENSKSNWLNLSNISYESIYTKIWYFWQEPLVFDGTVAENLSLNTSFDRQKLWEVLKIVRLDHLNLDDVIGEGGVLLSGWEKQRLALSRAFVFDYDIILLDEPTSNLDEELEKFILLEIFKKYDQKTIIVISHRPFILDYVDRIITIKKWEILEDKNKI